MAGLAAARTLVDAGATVVLVEARERVGGRTHTHRELGWDIDLGAAWIHGPLGNPLTPVARQAGVGGVLTSWHDDPRHLLVVDQDGHRLDVAAFTRGVASFWAGLSASHRSLRFRQGQLPGSLAEAVARGLPGSDLLAPVERIGFDHTATVSCQNLEAADPEQLDWASFDGIDLPGGNLMLVDGGYSGIVEHLAGGLTIHTGFVVREVVADRRRVAVRSADDVVTGDVAILTLPLGVLQADTVAFQPGLPSTHREALTRLGMGQAEKVVMVLDEPLWPEPTQALVRIPSDPGEPLVNFVVLPEAPVLIGYQGGSRARRLAALSPGELSGLVDRALRQLFGTAPTPRQVFRTAWGDDPFSAGAYSFHPVGTSRRHREALLQPVAGRVLFAGEATHPGWYATAHGAYESGVHAAWRALRMMG